MEHLKTKLVVNGIFNMSFGKTFFTGILLNSHNIVKKSMWQIVINGKPLKKIEIEGEQTVKKITAENNYRSLAASKIIDFTYDLDKDKIELILLE